ncbi:MAG: hypothetical protein ACYC1D_11855 [Acidimicrobiales bacterium]
MRAPAADPMRKDRRLASTASALAFPDAEEDPEVRFEAALPHLEHSDNASLVAISGVSGRKSNFVSGPYATVNTGSADTGSGVDR